jgi:hypothetical protein
MASPAISVRQQADNVSNVIQFVENLRKDICKGIRQGTLERELVMLHLDELYVLALKPLRSLNSSRSQICKMKTWVVSARIDMAQVDDKVLLTFISKELMEQDVRLAEDLVVDERFAAFLFQNNAVRKSLAATKALSVGVDRGPAQLQRPQRVLDCPKCHYEHHLRDCTSPVATLTRNGLPNYNWQDERPRADKFPKGGGGGGVSLVEGNRLSCPRRDLGEWISEILAY